MRLITKDPCASCGESTAFGGGKFVNRIPADDGWMCHECLDSAKNHETRKDQHHG